MERPEQLQHLSLLGGPLHRLGRRLGLVHGASNSAPLGLALGLGTWAVLVVLAVIDGASHRLLSLVVLPAHVRLLVAIPAFFVCEAWVDPRMGTFVETIVRSGVVPAETVPELDRETTRIRRWTDSWVPDAVCLALAVMWSVVGSQASLERAIAVFNPSRSPATFPLTGYWYWVVCLPLLRFLTLRWLLRLGVWWAFLWRLSRLELRLLPTHPDGLGGLGYLEVVNRHFLPLVLALSAVMAAAFAAEISAGLVAFEAVYPSLAMVLVVDVLLFLCPAFVFTPKLWACRVKGMSDYMVFASGYVRGFDRKWVRTDGPPEEPLLGTADIQSLADLGNSLNAVRSMRVIAIDLHLLIEFAVIALLPALPLLLLKYSIAELAQRSFSRLSGV
jgi:hypothetical protein